MHNVWHPTKKYQEGREKGQFNPQSGEKSVIGNQPKSDMDVGMSKDIKSYYNCIPCVEKAIEKTGHVKQRPGRYIDR